LKYLIGFDDEGSKIRLQSGKKTEIKAMKLMKIMNISNDSSGVFKKIPPDLTF